MLYFKFTSPYYATIAATSTTTALKEYTEAVCDLEEEPAEYTILSLWEFIDEVAKTGSEDTGKPIGADEARVEIGEFLQNGKQSEIFGIDASLV